MKKIQIIKFINVSTVFIDTLEKQSYCLEKQTNFSAGLSLKICIINTIF